MWEFINKNQETTSNTEEITLQDSETSEENIPQTQPTVNATTTQPESQDGTHSGIINAGDTASTLLQTWMPVADVNAMAEASRKLFPLRSLKEGHAYTVYVNDNSVEKFEYEIDDLKKLILTRDGDNGFSAQIEQIPYEILLERIDGVIDSSLFEAVADIGESPNLAVRMADIFAWEINFVKDLRQGDKFSLLVEKLFKDGEFKRYGKILYAEFINQDKPYKAFAYINENDSVTYFTETGDSLKRAFLQAPLSFTRISSGFTNRRLHPVFKDWRSHPAIDYAAPSGTPVKTVGNGVVTFAGWGKGAGNYIAIKHSNGYETMYLHLSGFAQGLKKGNKVSQGDVIGFVGSTGYSTGPHLDFRMKKNGTFLNPITALNPRGDSISKKELAEFKKMVDYYKEFVNDKKSLTEYVPYKEKS
ncbi:M23 family metallopeptidase [Desulfovibrio litoralis]|uniref:M23 family metallopeptidase n=1 Tax=Desulfovibrio litoralis TaxID=466107 RepID=UPI0011608533|nr:peptidoglycan DD-metalloendopeptidase family protein [Desulfovibrio litoralis]